MNLEHYLQSQGFKLEGDEWVWATSDERIAISMYSPKGSGKWYAEADVRDLTNRARRSEQIAHGTSKPAMEKKVVVWVQQNIGSDAALKSDYGEFGGFQ